MLRDQPWAPGPGPHNTYSFKAGTPHLHLPQSGKLAKKKKSLIRSASVLAKLHTSSLKCKILNCIPRNCRLVCRQLNCIRNSGGNTCFLSLSLSLFHLLQIHEEETLGKIMMMLSHYRFSIALSLAAVIFCNGCFSSLVRVLALYVSHLALSIHAQNCTRYTIDNKCIQQVFTE